MKSIAAAELPEEKKVGQREGGYDFAFGVDVE